MIDRVTLGVISHQPIASSMAGPGIRCWELARALADDANVILFTPDESDLDPAGFELVTYSGDTLTNLVASCDALLFQGFILNNYPSLKQLGKFLIIDLYVPMTLEALAQYKHLGPGEQNAMQDHILTAVLDQLTAGHFFICASERQRDYWLGLLSAVGRVTAEAYKQDSMLRRLIDTVPFGLPEEPPAATGKVLKGIHPGIGEGDKVLLWGGGVYNWLDPFTPIRAMSLVAERHPDIKLFFMGARHPDPNVPRMRAYDEAVSLSRDLGLINRSVIFNDRWVRYEDRAGYLLEADIGVNASPSHIETRFSFRTRILDCIWAALPVVTTEGDSLSSLVAARGMGLAVAAGDAEAYASAIERLVDDGELYESCRSELTAAAAEFRWVEITRCLKDYLRRIGQPGAGQYGINSLGVGRIWQEARKQKSLSVRLKRRLRNSPGIGFTYSRLKADYQELKGKFDPGPRKKR